MSSNSPTFIANIPTMDSMGLRKTQGFDSGSQVPLTNAIKKAEINTSSWREKKKKVTKTSNYAEIIKNYNTLKSKLKINE